MKKGRISQNGYFQTASSWLDMAVSTLHHWHRNRLNSDRRNALVKMMFKDLDDAQAEVMKKWQKKPELKGFVEKVKKHPRYKG